MDKLKQNAIVLGQYLYNKKKMRGVITKYKVISSGNIQNKPQFDSELYIYLDQKSKSILSF